MTTNRATTAILVENEVSAGSFPADGAEPRSVTEYEAACIGALMVSSEAGQDRVLSTVADSDFTDPRHRFILATIRQMRSAGAPIDQRSIVGWVDRHGSLPAGRQRSALATLLADLTTTAPAPSAGTWFAGLVVEHAARRQVRSAAARLAEIADGAALNDLQVTIRSVCETAETAVRRASRVIG